ncbi:MAG TPA: helix-turn-helix domain-containing protein [Gemmatimonadaceae bacterium]|nr:helix-turn-helix domain-containing protein [Gemmatimonadaceae bacterium]
MRRTERRSDCPINFAVQTFGDPWSLIILRDLMFTDRRTYGELLGAEERIATNVLAARLEHLQKTGLITRRDARYALTQKGLDLLPAMLDLISWSGKYDKRTAAPKPFLARIARDREGVIAEITARLRAEYGL